MLDKSKKIKVIIIINIIIMIIAFIGLEIYSYNFLKDVYKDSLETHNAFLKKEGINASPVVISYRLVKGFDYNEFEQNLRPTVEYKSKKRPLIFVICSYMDTQGLSYEQLLYSKVAKLSQRTAYDRSRGGEGVQLILHQLRRPDFYQKVPDAEYIIYTFLYDHFYRLNRYQMGPYSNYAGLRYKESNGKLVEAKPFLLPLYSSFSVQMVQSHIQKQKAENNDQCFDLFYKILVESKDTAKAHYKDLKFVIMLYTDPTYKSLTKNQIQKLKDAGFIVIDSEQLVGHELTSDKYRLSDFHPNEAAWDEVAPKLVKALNL